jgi:hypothetical protein
VGPGDLCSPPLNETEPYELYLERVINGARERRRD